MTSKNMSLLLDVKAWDSQKRVSLDTIEYFRDCIIHSWATILRRGKIFIHFGGLMSEKNGFLSRYNSSDKECIYTLLIIQFLPFFMPHKFFPHTSSSLASECPIKAVKWTLTFCPLTFFVLVDAFPRPLVMFCSLDWESKQLFFYSFSCLFCQTLVVIVY